MKSFFFSLLLFPLLAPVPAAQVPWHLDRIDQEQPTLDGVFSPNCLAGTPTTVYIVSAGIDTTLPEFGDRASVGYGSSTDLGANGIFGGHGTYLASLVGGEIHGVDKTAKLVSVQVLDPQVPVQINDILNGLSWIETTYSSGSNVVVLGFGQLIATSGVNIGLQQAIKSFIDSTGMTVVVPAGDIAFDNCNTFIGGLYDAITVGATDQFDAMWSSSAYGSCVDLFAPGVDVEAAAPGGGLVTHSGTDAAAALVAGAASLRMRVIGSASGLLADATSGVLTGVNGSPNLLLYVDDACPLPWTNEGSALAGINGDPLLIGSGTLVAGSMNSVELSNAAPSAFSALFLAPSSTPTPFSGGTLKTVPWLKVFFRTTSPTGEYSVSFVMPAGLPPGTELWLQWAITDTAAIEGVSLSNAIRGVTP